MKKAAILLMLVSALWMVADAVHTPNDFTVDGTLYNTLLTANTMLCLGASKQHTSIGTVSGTNVVFGGVQAAYKTSDGSAGVTTNITAGLVTFTVKNGIITSVSL